MEELQFFGSQKGVANDSSRQGYDAASMGNRIPTFRGIGILKKQLVKIRNQQRGGFYHVIKN
jgi:hypothetical protein